MSSEDLKRLASAGQPPASCATSATPTPLAGVLASSHDACTAAAGSDPQFVVLTAEGGPSITLQRAPAAPEPAHAPRRAGAMAAFELVADASGDLVPETGLKRARDHVLQADQHVEAPSAPPAGAASLPAAPAVAVVSNAPAAAPRPSGPSAHAGATKRVTPVVKLGAGKVPNAFAAVAAAAAAAADAPLPPPPAPGLSAWRRLPNATAGDAGPRSGFAPKKQQLAPLADRRGDRSGEPRVKPAPSTQPLRSRERWTQTLASAAANFRGKPDTASAAAFVAAFETLQPIGARFPSELAKAAEAASRFFLWGEMRGGRQHLELHAADADLAKQIARSLAADGSPGGGMMQLTEPGTRIRIGQKSGARAVLIAQLRAAEINYLSIQGGLRVAARPAAVAQLTDRVLFSEETGERVAAKPAPPPIENTAFLVTGTGEPVMMAEDAARAAITAARGIAEVLGDSELGSRIPPSKAPQHLAAKLQITIGFRLTAPPKKATTIILATGTRVRFAGQCTEPRKAAAPRDDYLNDARVLLGLKTTAALAAPAAAGAKTSAAPRTTNADAQCGLRSANLAVDASIAPPAPPARAAVAPQEPPTRRNDIEDANTALDSATTQSRAPPSTGGQETPSPAKPDEQGKEVTESEEGDGERDKKRRAPMPGAAAAR